MENLTNICACDSLEHQVKFKYDSEYDKLYLTVHLTTSNFFWRLVTGVRYIFGYKCGYGEWDEFLFKPEDLIKLKDLLNKREETDRRTLQVDLNGVELKKVEEFIEKWRKFNVQ